MTKVGALVNTIGLALGVAGAGLIWKFGLPPDVDRHGYDYIIAEQENEDEKDKARRYDKRSGIGFALLILGFIVQAIGNFL